MLAFEGKVEALIDGADEKELSASVYIRFLPDQLVS